MAETKAVFSPSIVGNKELNCLIGWDSVSQQQISYKAGTNITLDPGTGEISASGGGTPTNSFETIAVSGQSDVVADSATDTLTLAAGTGISITTNAGTDTITITNTASAGSGLTSGQVFARIMNVGVI